MFISKGSTSHNGDVPFLIKQFSKVDIKQNNISFVKQVSRISMRSVPFARKLVCLHNEVRVVPNN